MIFGRFLWNFTRFLGDFCGKYEKAVIAVVIRAVATGHEGDVVFFAVITGSVNARGETVGLPCAVKIGFFFYGADRDGIEVGGAVKVGDRESVADV